MSKLVMLLFQVTMKKNYIYNTLWKISRQQFDGKIRVLGKITTPQIIH